MAKPTTCGTVARISCPWCGSTNPPQATDPVIAHAEYGCPDDPKWQRRNPLMCSDCYHCGAPEDWGYGEVAK